MDIEIRMTGRGGPEVLGAIETTPQVPGAGEIRLRQHAIGVSFIDIYHRRGLYPLPEPHVPGVEGAGIVEAVGPGVEDIGIGDRIAYAGVPGGYAATRLLPAWRAVRLSDDIPLEIAATSMLRGLTAHMLLTVTYPVAAGTVLLVHAAAGGLGVMLTRWARHLGATVIGTASTEEKAAFAIANGADHVIVGRSADIVQNISNLTDGKGVDLVIDGIGGEMLQKSLGCVRPFGTVASIGWVAGPVPPIRIEDLGLAALAKPSVMAYSADPNRYADASPAVIAALQAGIVSEIGGTYPLAEAARAHADLEAGRTTGSQVLVP
ncbi:NADPH2:quinone reductase [Rhodobium orientis]|uniref:Alcohol dehydrogenase n=1 Tax=Rhodobium orientis TaxID=34017 RepID=A0A327JUU6_9HYPH|nr:quinone oxidoreductase [Rhodobium orientis]MBB4302497.1 NADPH2:quinone reductase [Rhodobium orientis]MBK5949346.1 alcohol dehydrogenase [Rhodobium orientis]RAI28692.1 alcohol dehydrogenase [Rhodobium orientis]